MQRETSVHAGSELLSVGCWCRVRSFHSRLTPYPVALNRRLILAVTFAPFLPTTVFNVTVQMQGSAFRNSALISEPVFTAILETEDVRSLQVMSLEANWFNVSGPLIRNGECHPRMRTGHSLNTRSSY